MIHLENVILTELIAYQDICSKATITQLKEWEDNPQHGKKYLQIMYLW